MVGGLVYEFFDVVFVDGVNGGILGGNICNVFFYNFKCVEFVDFVFLIELEMIECEVLVLDVFVGLRFLFVVIFNFCGCNVMIFNNYMILWFGLIFVFGGV